MIDEQALEGVDIAALQPSDLAEIQGTGQRFGIAPINERRVY
ncbi:hypothetical protein [Legionella hackeliae]|uniref:Uncharacterized protein n=1 Tax=Legionella hackeliae TaxID=449 RepID=A0A0A8UMW4_LEGHA|nr:hypothetical protein [Legionella hackeliae]CEK10073.1 protein of unknown function [Legionella hackeliae]